MVGVLPRPMSSARQPPRSAESRKPSQASASPWYDRSSPWKPSGAGAGSVDDRRGPGQQVGGPAAALDADAAGEGRALRARGRGAASPRPTAGWPRPARRAPRRPPSRSAWSSSIQRPFDRTSGRASAASRVMSAAVSSTSSKSADQRTLASCWAPTTDCVSGIGHHPQRRGGAPHGQRRDPHVEAGGHQHRAGLGHQLPGLGLAEDDLAAAVAAGPAQRREQALEPGELLLERLALLAGVDHRDLDRLQPVVLGRGEHREVPGAALVGGVELHDEADDVLRGDGLGPPLEVADQLAAEPGGRVELAAVEAAEEGLGDVGAGAGAGRRRRHLDRAWPRRGRWRRPCR